MPTTGVVSRAAPAIGGSTGLRPSSWDGSPIPRLVPNGSSRTGLKVGDVAVAHEPGVVLADFGDHSLEHDTLLILKDGGGYLARDYWVEAGVFHLLTAGGEHKMFPVSRLDLEETVHVNRERNAEFVLRTPEASQP